ncbi:carboxylesterase/lipase family protein [Saccharothrix coeruleofusca]|uniref:Carboxylic ester hydrolase n=1 Tax=Saccharothrix coeruleofusca TaxID=33919 RepID=A0A918AXL7_9PSEU|nr:carboxylic ester hydrolase [Saccharothrix coeruleofusca]
MRHEEITVDTGAVRGYLADGVAVFHAIPYAAAPHGAARFAPPQPPTPWQGVRDATRPGPTAPQPKRDAFGGLDMSPYFGPGWVPGEEYLTVDVRTPAGRHADLPVMVFVHGGGFTAGSTRSPLYDGTAFARDGVVLVTVNYRLNVAGFLHLPDAPDNRGLLDVLAALGWVRRNIAAFGGDPGNVTVFGQSAGATLLGAVLADPRSEGLLRRAILQSGSGTGAFTPAQAGIVTRRLAEHLGVPGTAAALADVPDADLVAACSALGGLDLAADGTPDPLMGLSPFSVVADEQPATALARGVAADVDLMVGTNSDEGHLYLVPLGKFTTSTWQDVHDTAALMSADPAAEVAARRRAHPDATAGQIRSRLLAEGLFGAGTRALARAHPAHNTYVYEFTWQSSELGATHTMELPFVFDLAHLAALSGRGKLFGTAVPPSELAKEVHADWVRFAATGTPGWPPSHDVGKYYPTHP